MALVVSLALCIAAIYSCCAFAELTSEYAHHAALDPEERMKLYWTIDWEDESVSFAVEAETTGWVGLGFSSSGQMIGSDMVIGWVKDGKGYLTDRFADAKAIPPMDEQQDYELTGSHESGGKTVLKFKRKIDTCDPRDYRLEQGATKVVFAYHTDDPVSPTEVKYHVFRGIRTILLLNSMERRNIDESGWQEMLVTNLNVTIPPNETTYWCSLRKAPVLNTKHHVVKFEPYIQKGNEGFVHHFILYECDGNFTEKDYDQGVDCFDVANMPFARCRRLTMMAAWAVGGEAFYFPPHAGFPLGLDDSPNSFLLEMHYDNPENLKNHKDSSGLRIYYTDKLRKYDSGIFSVGMRVDQMHIIPPKQDSWISVGYCTHQCTESLYKSTNLPEGGINVFAAFLHTHLAGRATWTKHVRGGKELPEIARDNHYDFNFQDIQVLRKEVNIQPGDDLIHYCKYNTMNRDKLIKGGLSTRDEMCLDFLFYYPRIPRFRHCRSTSYEPMDRFIDKYFDGVNATSVSNPLVNMSINWNQSMASNLENYEQETKSVVQGCKAKYIKTIADFKNLNLIVPIPRITEPLPPKTSNCPEATKPAAKGPGNHVSCLTSHPVLVLLLTTMCAVFGGFS